MPPSPIRGVILDVDGTLVDSNDAHARAWVDAFAEFEHDVPFARVRALIGMGGDNLLPEAIGLDAESAEGKALLKRRGEIFKERYLQTVNPFAGTREMVQRMSDEGLKIAIGTSAKEDELKPLLKIAGVEDLIDTRTTSDDAESSKPDPDIIQAALARLRLPPAEVLMVGDTPYDIEAAARAGVYTVAFRSGGWTDDGLRGAMAVYAGPWDLHDRFATSPFAPKGGKPTVP
jgi:phosphoglycolate phosphatase-like HAD superfamily hydrolase